MAERNGNFDRRAFFKAIPVVGAAVYAANEAGLFIPKAVEAAPAASPAGELYTTEGIKDQATNVLTTQVSAEKFGNPKVNTIGMGTEAFIAEPGVLGFGAGTEQSVVDRTQGAGEYWEELDMEVLRFKGPATLSVPGQKFLVIHGNQFTIRRGNGKVLRFDGRPDTKWTALVKGYDNRNEDIELDFQPGNCKVHELPPGPYWSEGQFKQFMRTSHGKGLDGKTRDDCGPVGCLTTYFVGYNFNTDALASVKQTGIDGAWQPNGKNF